MVKITKKNKKISKIINSKIEYKIEKAINLLKKIQSNKFIESVDIAINLGINSKKTDQNIKGIMQLPYGIGKKIKIAVFTQGDNAIIAKQYGADFVGNKELVEEFKSKKIKVDIVIASPDTMNIIKQLGPILGPRGLMPNPKTGTITNNIKEAIQNAKNGQIKYKNDKYGIIHTTIGKINFSNKQLKENINTFIINLKKLKPTKSKGNFIKKIVLSTTMSPGIKIKQENI